MFSRKSVLFLILLVMVFFASIVSAQTFDYGNLATSGLSFFPYITNMPYSPNLTKGGNRWTITFYNDRSSTHEQWATQGICFQYINKVGTHMSYKWYSDTFPDWNGWATQEGDQIVMHGDYAGNVGHDGMIWDIVTSSTNNEGAGHWWEWRENADYGKTIGFANAKLERVGYCSSYTADEGRYEANLMALPLDGTGRIMESPMGLPVE